MGSGAAEVVITAERKALWLRFFFLPRVPRDVAKPRGDGDASGKTPKLMGYKYRDARLSCGGLDFRMVTVKKATAGQSVFVCQMSPRCFRIELAVFFAVNARKFDNSKNAAGLH